MKKILFAAKNLEIGGIENALINLLNYLSDKDYDITLVLEEKKGKLLKKIDYRVKIIEYQKSSKKNVILRKLENFIKQTLFKNKYKNKFDVAISFATYSLPASFIARTASKKAILWGHADYLSLFNGDEKKVKNFFEQLHYKEFSKIVFVSKKAKNTFLQVFPEQASNTYFCNNIIDYAKILELQEMQIYDVSKDDKIVTFINVGRHEEAQKRLSRIIEASKKLKEDNLNFRVIFVGDGPDNTKYRNMVKEFNIEENIIFIGAKINPYPYYKVSDCVVLSSEYEGYPVVFLESFILNKPIITTDVSDSEDIKSGRGIIVNKDSNSIYEAMKSFINKKYIINQEFDYKKYNNDVIKNIISIIE